MTALSGLAANFPLGLESVHLLRQLRDELVKQTSSLTGKERPKASTSLLAKTLGPTAWTLLGKVAKTTADTVEPETAETVARIALEAAKCIQAGEKDLKMGVWDFDKMLSNVLMKMTELVVRSSIQLQKNSYLLEFVEVCFRRLQTRSVEPSLLEGDIRRLSLQNGLPEIDCSIEFRPEDSLVLVQIALIAQECLLRIHLSMGVSIRKHIEALNRTFSRLCSNDSSVALKNLIAFTSGLLKTRFFAIDEFLHAVSCVSGHAESLLSDDEWVSIAISLPTLEQLKDGSPSVLAGLLAVESGSIPSLEGLLSDRPRFLALFLARIVNQVACHTALLKDVPRFRAEDVQPSQAFSKHLLSALDRLRPKLPDLLKLSHGVVFVLDLDVVLAALNLPEKTLMTWSYSVLHALSHSDPTSKDAQALCHRLCIAMLKSARIEPDHWPKIFKQIIASAAMFCDLSALKLALGESEKRLWTLDLFLQRMPSNLSPVQFQELTCILFFEQRNSRDDAAAMTLWAKLFAKQEAGTIVPMQTIDDFYRAVTAVFLAISDGSMAMSLTDCLRGSAQTARLNAIDCDACLSLAAFRASRCSARRAEIVQKLSVFSTRISELPSSLFCLELIEHTLAQTLENAQEEDLRTLIASLASSGEQSGSHWHHLRSSLLQRASFVFFDELPSDGAAVDYSRLWGLQQKEDVVEGLGHAYSAYCQGDVTEALKRGYHLLKSVFCESSRVRPERITDLLDMLLWLHRLAASSQNVSEAKYFLRQLVALKDGFSSLIVANLIARVQFEFNILIGRDGGFDWKQAESILKSAAFKSFFWNSQCLERLHDCRTRIKDILPFSWRKALLCSGIKGIDAPLVKRATELYSTAQAEFELARERNLVYCIGEWSKMLLALAFLRSVYSDQVESCDLFMHFELARRPEEHTKWSREALARSLSLMNCTLGILMDHFSGVLWMLQAGSSSDLLVFRVPIDADAFGGHLSRMHRISAANTDSLRGTKSIGDDNDKKAEWWRLRRDLDADLNALAEALAEAMFRDLEPLIVPTRVACGSKAKLLHEQLTLCLEQTTSVKLSLQLARVLAVLGSVPKRHRLEMLAKCVCALDSAVSVDLLVSGFRKCFDNTFDLGSVFDCDAKGNDPTNAVLCQLLLDKHLNCLPIESFSALSSFGFVRLPSLLYRQSAKDAEELQERAFYILNPSGDLVKTQERFESLFKSLPAWKGIVGRPPTSDEFLEAVAGGRFEFFVYFGHSGGESYVKLKDLPGRACKDAASALLIGCSSGRIVSNGIFPPESTIHYYLEGRSPVVVSNLWDVTDKDIDTYIRQVMEETGLLEPSKSPTSLPIIANAVQQSRSCCFLKSLNGRAPIVYSCLL